MTTVHTPGALLRRPWEPGSPAASRLVTPGLAWRAKAYRPRGRAGGGPEPWRGVCCRGTQQTRGGRCGPWGTEGEPHGGAGAALPRPQPHASLGQRRGRCPTSTLAPQPHPASPLVSSHPLSPPTPPKAASLSTSSQGRGSPGPESPRAPQRGRQAGRRDQRTLPATLLCPGGSCCPEVGGGGPRTAGLFLREPGSFKGLKATNGDLSFSLVPGAELLVETPTVSWAPE